MTKLFHLAIIASLLSGCALSPKYPFQVVNDVKVFDMQVAKEMEKGFLLYKLLIPEMPEKPTERPLIYAFPALGVSAEEYMWTWERDAAERGYMVLIPDTRRNYRDKTADRAEFRGILDDVISKYQVDESRIYLAGTSLGTAHSRWLVQENPQRWKAVVWIASSPREIILKEEGQPTPPILYIHSKKDTVFKLEDVQNQVNKLQAEGRSVDLFVDPKAGHDHYEKWNDMIFDWFETGKLKESN